MNKVHLGLIFAGLVIVGVFVVAPWMVNEIVNHDENMTALKQSNDLINRQNAPTAVELPTYQFTRTQNDVLGAGVLNVAEDTPVYRNGHLMLTQTEWEEKFPCLQAK
jgi:hypothetical protein